MGERQAGRTGDEVPTWTKGQIDNMIQKAKAGHPEENYHGAAKELLAAFGKQSGGVVGKRFYVLGSQTPWVEALLLSAGASHVTTIEYGAVQSSDERVSTMTPGQVRKMFL